MQPLRPDDEESLETDCPVCHVRPGRWCVYVWPRSRAGLPTKRLHVERRHKLWLERPVTRSRERTMLPAAQTLRAFDRDQDETLRAWLRDHVHLLLALAADPTP